MTPDADGRGATVTLSSRGAARMTLVYQGQKASGLYEDAHNIVYTSGGAQRQEPVSVTLKLG